MTFAIGALVGSLTWIGRGQAAGALRQPLAAWAVGVGGLFGYHALYFLALRFAPPAEAGLLNYLWPLLIVLFSSLLPGERLAPHHIIGALLGLAGTVLLFAGDTGRFAPGQAARPDRGICRGLRVGDLFGAVAQAQGRADRRGGGLLRGDRTARHGACAGRGHGLARYDVAMASVIALGIGPVGAAFYAWDIGMKRGESACSVRPPMRRRCSRPRF